MNDLTSKKLGIVAGEGALPKTVAVNAARCGIETYAVCINPSARRDLGDSCNVAVQISGAKPESCIAFFRQHGVTELLFIGKVCKLWAIAQIPFLDPLGRVCLSRMVDLGDNTFHEVIRSMAAEQGFRVVHQAKYLTDWLAGTGFLNSIQPTSEQMDDVEFGISIAKRSSELEVSQTVVVRRRAVMALEAAEGTDQAIIRGCKLAGSQAVVVKVAWANQLQEFDIPTVGPRTIKIMHQHGGKVLALQAGRTFVIEPTHTASVAEKHGIALIGFDDA